MQMWGCDVSELAQCVSNYCNAMETLLHLGYPAFHFHLYLKDTLAWATEELWWGAYLLWLRCCALRHGQPMLV